ncbi:UDP-glucose 4-epimerase GalE [Tuberibacillus sp. Marseille-P3662]|uniref:UDP-glucose 4-epimerase GalE n=1 Tax=Tuberibacillus sp. Marseille-P3662 TaxID=1965358 RepID=UPI000A1C98F1|nr:UDP-glucose 4-epimerase GalE [Tuberibacillus sp. Marseille-P3662]
MILVTGGAGYIGSHTVLYLHQKGENVVVLDNMTKGHREALQDVKVYEGDISDGEVLDQIFSEQTIDSVIHFAASSVVGESVKQPLEYYRNNVVGTHALLEKMIEHDVKNIVFSSTAATYGEPSQVPIPETEVTEPTNPYGETKLAIEKMLHWADQAYGLNFAALRYFNAAGDDPDGRIGEDHDPETHLIPLVLQVALGQRDQIYMFGDDYATKDGTCIRDYVHVMDLAQAHYLALKKIAETGESGIYNLGNGSGFSVKEVIDTCRKVTGHAIPAEVAERRAGDPAVLVASSEKAKTELGWQPKYAELETIIEHAWQWHKDHPDGFAE